MARSRSSKSKKQNRERFRMIMLYITCCGRKPTIEELDADNIEEKEPSKVEYIPNDPIGYIGDDSSNGGDNGAGDTSATKATNPKRPTLPPRPPPPKRPFRSTKPGTVVNGKETTKVKGDGKQYNRDGVRNEQGRVKTTMLENARIPKRPLPGRRVPPRRPPPPMKATSTITVTPRKKAEPPMRPPPPASHLIAELLERNRKMAITALRLDVAQSDETASPEPAVSQSLVNTDKSSQSAIGSHTALDDYPAGMNPFGDDNDNDNDDEMGDENVEVGIVVDDDDVDDDKKVRSSQTRDDYPVELNPFADDDD